MSEVPEAAGREYFREDASESSDDAALSDPDTDEVESQDEEDVFEAADHVAEDVYRDAQEDISADSPTADYHEEEVQAYFARHRPQGDDQPRQQFPDPPSEYASPGYSTAADDEAAHADDSESAAQTASHSQQQQEAASEPALTAETSDNAALPNIEAVTVDESELQQESPAKEDEPSASAAAESSNEEADEQDTARQPDLPEIQEVLEDAAAPDEAEAQPSSITAASETSSQTHEAEGPATSTAQTKLADIPEQSVSPPTEAEPVLEQAQPASQPASEAAAEPAAEEAAAKPASEEQAAAELESAAAADSKANTEADASSKTAEETATTINTAARESATRDSTSASSSGRAMPRLPSLPVRRTQLPRPSAQPGAFNTGSAEEPPRPNIAALTEPAPPKPTMETQLPPTATGTAKEEAPVAPVVNTQQPASSAEQPVPPSAPPQVAESIAGVTDKPIKPTDNPVPAEPSTPAATAAANNGQTEAKEASAVNGNGSPAPAAAPGVPSSNAEAPAKPSASSRGPALPARAGSSSGPALPARTGASNASASAARPSGSANPSIPPRQPAANPPAQQSANNGQSGTVAVAGGGEAAEEGDEHHALREKVQGFRELLVRLTLRLGQSTRGTIVQQVNYRLDLAERLRLPGSSTAGRKRFGFEAACRKAEQQEDQNPEEPLPFACTVMVIGMSGVGKSATINSILDKNEAAPTNAFGLGTKDIKQISGTVAGVKIKFIDTPGLQPSVGNIHSNQQKLNLMHSAFKKHKPDLVVYMDRADVLRTDAADVPLLRAITETFGPSLWFNTIVALTHAAAAPPDGNNGPLTYDTYTRGRTQLLQQNIRQATGDMRLLNPVALVENHPACRKNERGHAVLPNQLVWKPHFLLLLLSSKLLSDTDSLLKIQPGSDAQEAQRKAMRQLLQGRKMPPIPYLMANFIQKKKPRKYPDEERDFRHNSELPKMDRYEARDEIRKRWQYSKMRFDEHMAERRAIHSMVPAPDIPLQPTFDPDYRADRYRYMEPAPDAPLCRPVMDPNGLDHDDGMNAFTVEKSTVLRPKGLYVGGAPAFISAQVHKDKDMFHIVSEGEASYYHTHKLVSTASVDAQTVQSDALFVGKLETRFNSRPKRPINPTRKGGKVKLGRKNKTGLGVLVSRLKEDGGLPTKGPIVYGAKVEDRLKVSENLKLNVASATLMNKTDGRGMPKEQAWSHSLEARSRLGEEGKIQVIGGVSNSRFRGKSSYGFNAATEVVATKGTTVASSMQLNSEQKTGKLLLRVSSRDKPQIGYSLLFPVLGFIVNKFKRRTE